MLMKTVQRKVSRVQISHDWRIRALFLEIYSCIKKLFGADVKYTRDLKSILNDENNRSAP